jgi:hypothetical protein
VEKTTLHFQGKEVTQARSHLDEGELVMVGPIIRVGYSSSLGMLSYTGDGGTQGRDAVLDFWIDCEQSMEGVPVYPPGDAGNGELRAIHVLSLRADGKRELWDIYGLVLRELRPGGAGTSIVMTERVGIFAGHGFSEDGLTGWERERVGMI